MRKYQMVARVNESRAPERFIDIGRGWPYVLALFLMSCGEKPPVPPTPPEYVDAVPPFSRTTCVEANTNERQVFELAASAIELPRNGRHKHANSLEVGAREFLRKGLERDTGGQEWVDVCTPQDILVRAAAAINTKGLGRGRIGEWQLDFVASLPGISAGVVGQVASVAFHRNPQPSSVFKYKDLRPYARSILATIGEHIEPMRKSRFRKWGMKRRWVQVPRRSPLPRVTKAH